MNGKLKSVLARVAAIVLLAGLSTGCMSPMALKKTSASVDLSRKSIAVFTLKTSNAFSPDYQPKVQTVDLVSDSTGKTRRFFVTPDAYDLSRGHVSGFFPGSNDVCDIVVSAAVEPGAYTLKEVRGEGSHNTPGIMVARAILLGPGAAGGVMGCFNFPVDTHFTVPSGAVTYVGRLEMVNRKRNAGERRAGPLFPLLDQRLSGFAGGTFDINVSDNSESDIPYLRQLYPCLEGVDIDKDIMRQ